MTTKRKATAPLRSACSASYGGRPAGAVRHRPAHGRRNHLQPRFDNRAQQAQALIGSVRAELFDAETGERDFLLTGRAEYRQAYKTAMRALPAKLTDLRRMTADDPVQLQNVRELESLVNQKMAELRTTLEFVPSAFRFRARWTSFARTTPRFE